MATTRMATAPAPALARVTRAKGGSDRTPPTLSGRSSKREGRAPVLSLDKALAILNCFEAGGQLSVAEISRHLEVHPTIVSRMLSTLERHGYVEQLEERGKYIAGVMSVVLANAAVQELPLRRQALPVLTRLADEHHVDANLGMLHDGLALYLAHVSRDPALRAHSLIGKR